MKEIILSCHLSAVQKESKVETQGRNLEATTEAEITEKSCFLT